jgi:hypothetical protein
MDELPGDPVVEETDCEAAVEQGSEQPDDGAVEPVEAAGEGELATLFAAGCLGAPGGAWGGAAAPVNRAIAVGRRNGVPLFSRKRSSGSTTSDHNTSQKRSDAADLSNGTRPTPEMDRTARQIAALLGHPNWGFGNLVVDCGRYRVQLLYRTNIGGNHFNHVHVGVRMN